MSMPDRHLQGIAGDVRQMQDALQQIAQGYCYVGGERRYLEPADLRETAERCLTILGYRKEGGS